jgi:hypothetical protein
MAADLNPESRLSDKEVLDQISTFVSSAEDVLPNLDTDLQDVCRK